ncbi:nicotinate-nucleotide adenylyltransferase [Martelella alba]|uniref:Probable nicotinate-nucleotide adenylyltransferase n=1 Tax=Martelella alba TaxID=2590451 RepID=A0A506UF39_9HYPH|nr:nicotinate-nucleotide adenylyltransferase [Martelella alba]TPW31821.1 nicotinate-nucleotide adenylyltransferase [Martelella alba]
MPHCERGMVIGLFGGSFNPPHEGHLLVAKLAIQRLGLDQLWWMVTPGNPLKTGSAPLAERLGESRRLARDPHIKVTALEKGLATSYTAKTIRIIKARHPGVHFIWIMGADNLADFHRWQQWKAIARMVPMAVIDRPGSSLAHLSSKTARTFARYRVHERNAATLHLRQPPAWTFIHGPRSPLSSTALRIGLNRADDRRDTE